MVRNVVCVSQAYLRRRNDVVASCVFSSSQSQPTTCNKSQTFFVVENGEGDTREEEETRATEARKCWKGITFIKPSIIPLVSFSLM